MKTLEAEIWEKDGVTYLSVESVRRFFRDRGRDRLIRDRKALSIPLGRALTEGEVVSIALMRLYVSLNPGIHGRDDFVLMRRQKALLASVFRKLGQDLQSVENHILERLNNDTRRTA